MGEYEKLRWSKKRVEREKLSECKLFIKIISSESVINCLQAKLVEILGLRNDMFQRLIEGYSSYAMYLHDLETFILLTEDVA